MTRDRALYLRSIIEQAAASLSDETALNAVELFPAWAADTAYEADIRVRYEGNLYRVVQAHTSQEGWEPPNVPALFTQVALPGEIPVWVQPTGAQDAYMTGDQVHYPTASGPVYESVMDYNVYDPLTYGWTLVE